MKLALLSLCLLFFCSCGQKKRDGNNTPAPLQTTPKDTIQPNLDDVPSSGIPQPESSDSEMQPEKNDNQTEDDIVVPDVVIPEGFIASKNKLFYVRADWNLPLQSGGDGTNEVNLHFIYPDSTPIKTPLILGFHPEMPTMGHGTDESTQTFSLIAEGNIQASGIYFNMPGWEGGWIVILKVLIDDQEDSINLSLPEVL